MKMPDVVLVGADQVVVADGDLASNPGAEEPPDDAEDNPVRRLKPSRPRQQDRGASS